ADGAHPAAGPGGDAQPAGSGRAGRHAGRLARRHGRGGAAHPPPRPPLRARQGRASQGRGPRRAVERQGVHRVQHAPNRVNQHARHRVHALGGDRRWPRPGTGHRRRDSRGQGLWDAGDPRRLRPRPRGGPAPTLHRGVVMSETDDEGKMSFFEHLAELRTRIIWSLIPAAIGLGIALYFTKAILTFIQRPLTKMDMKLVFTTPTEAFWTYMKVAMIAGLFIAMPVVLWNVWAFVAPGLHKHERKYAAPFVIVGSLLFLLGGAFALLVIVPYASNFLVSFGQEQGLQPMISVAS